MRRWTIWLALMAMMAGVAVLRPAAAQAEPYCEIAWGSQSKAGGDLSAAPIVNVRAGEHACYDRLVVDLAGTRVGFKAQYVAAVHTQGRGEVLSLRGGAFLEIVVLNPTYDITTGAVTYHPANKNELVNVAGWQTFRQVADGGSFEGYTTIGLGARARLPFRVFTLAGRGSTHSRLVIDVAHHWHGPIRFQRSQNRR